MKVGPACAFVRTPGLLWRRVGDEAVVLAPATEQVVLLSATAAAVWDRLAEPAAVSDLARLFSRAGNEQTEQIVRDVQALLDDLVRLGVAARSHGLVRS